MQTTTGSSVSLFCLASGSPDLKYSWFREDAAMGVQTNTSMLTIMNVGRADEVDYVCNVSLFDILIGECRVSMLIQGMLAKYSALAPHYRLFIYLPRS